MTVRILASALIAALLLIGNIPSALQEASQPAITPTQAVPVQPTPEQAAPVQTLSQSQAIAAALTHAGLTEDSVTALHAHYDRDDRVPHWDVEFRQSDWEYDYEIRSDGTVLQSQKEYDPQKTMPPATQPPETQPPATQPATKALNAEDAKSIALAHAGLTKDQVKALRAEYDYDDGVPKFEVEFISGGWEYDYDIHATTGKLLDFDKDWDD